MPILTDEQLNRPYFGKIGGFPPVPIIHALEEYDGSEKCCIACTQLSDFKYSEREKKKVLKDWLHFLQTNTIAFTAIHFNSRVNQALFDAACWQENLVELRCKWGSYPDLTALTKLKKLKFLYLGSNPSVTDLEPITQLEDLAVLYLENFKRIEDYSPLTKLKNLEQLVISGPTLNDIHIQDLDFLGDMPNLRSFRLMNAVVRKKYTPQERELLRRRGTQIQGIWDQEWWNL